MINNTISDDQISAVHSLVGKTLKTGWEVLEKTKIKPGGTGGNFSVCYIVKKDGRIGFLKAINTLTFLRADEDQIKAQADMLNTYNFEKEILSRCKNKNLTKVSKLLEASFEKIDGFLIPGVYYMIFEKADSDVREHINFTSLVDNLWKLKSLHNIATGIKQLHSINVSHQDLKPSNVFIFEDGISKIGDLGRALSDNLSAPHSDYDFSGDIRYAPPEVFHKFVLPEWRDKVFAIDCFLLGSMATFYFTGQSMLALMGSKISSSLNIFNLDFENALPYWINAFDEALIVIKEHTEDIEGQDKLLEAIKMLCYPDPRNRGHIKNLKSIGNNYQMDRFVEIFNLLARKAEYKITK